MNNPILRDTIDAVTGRRYHERDCYSDDTPTDPDATSIYDLSPATARYVGRSAAINFRRQISSARENVQRLREALAAGWDIAPELEHEERRLSELLLIDNQ